jgi:hypothetical protein
MLPVTRGLKRGGHHLMGEMRRRKCSDIFPSTEVAGGGARPASRACSISVWGRKMNAGWARWAKWPCGLATQPIGLKLGKIPFRIK